MHMPVPATADGTATPSATPSVTHPVPTQQPTQMQAGAKAEDQYVAHAVTAGMPTHSVTGTDAPPSDQYQLTHASTALPIAAAASADAAKLPLSLDTAGEEQRGSIPGGDAPLGPGIVRSTSDAMDTS